MTPDQSFYLLYFILRLAGNVFVGLCVCPKSTAQASNVRLENRIDGKRTG